MVEKQILGTYEKARLCFSHAETLIPFTCLLGLFLEQEEGALIILTNKCNPLICNMLSFSRYIAFLCHNVNVFQWYWTKSLGTKRHVLLSSHDYHVVILFDPNTKGTLKCNMVVILITFFYTITLNLLCLSNKTRMTPSQ